MKRIILFTVIALLCGAVGWLLGAQYALSKATATHNAASLVFLTGIHQALLDSNVASAKRTTEMAVTGHVLVIEDAAKITVRDTIRHFLTPGSNIYPPHTLLGVYDHFAKQPDLLSPEAMGFLKANADNKK